MQLKLRQRQIWTSLSPNSALFDSTCLWAKSAKQMCINMQTLQNTEPKHTSWNSQAQMELKLICIWAVFEPGLQLDKIRSETDRLNVAAFWTEMQLDKMLFDKFEHNAEIHRLKFNGFQPCIWAVKFSPNSAWFLTPRVCMSKAQNKICINCKYSKHRIETFTLKWAQNMQILNLSLDCNSKKFAIR